MSKIKHIADVLISEAIFGLEIAGAQYEPGFNANFHVRSHSGRLYAVAHGEDHALSIASTLASEYNTPYMVHFNHGGGKEELYTAHYPDGSMKFSDSLNNDELSKINTNLAAWKAKASQWPYK